MVKHLEVDDGETVTKVDAPYGYRKDGVTPRNPPGRKSTPATPTVPTAAHAAPPIRRNNPRPPPRQQVRETTREPSRANASVLGRDGQELARLYRQVNSSQCRRGGVSEPVLLRHLFNLDDGALFHGCLTVRTAFRGRRRVLSVGAWA